MLLYYYYILLLLSTTTYYYYIENVPLCKKQRSLCVLSWCLNTTTITRDSILFMMGTLNNTKLVFFQKENITKKVILIISRVDEWRRRRKVWTTRKCWIDSEERPFLLKGVATKWIGPQAIHWRKKKIITKKKLLHTTVSSKKLHTTARIIIIITMILPLKCRNYSPRRTKQQTENVEIKQALL